MKFERENNNWRVYNNTMKKTTFLFIGCLVGEIFVMHFGPSQ